MVNLGENDGSVILSEAKNLALYIAVIFPRKSG